MEGDYGYRRDYPDQGRDRGGYGPDRGYDRGYDRGGYGPDRGFDRGGYGGDRYGRGYRPRSPPRRVRYDERMIRDSTTLFVGNLSFRAEERDLDDLFGSCGRIRNISLGINRRTGQPKGHAFVEFHTRVAAEEALSKYQGLLFMDRNIRLDWDPGLDAKRSSRPYSPRRRSRSRSPRRSLSPRRSRSPPRRSLSPPPRRGSPVRDSPRRSPSPNRKRSRSPPSRSPSPDRR
eukprot:TRINITY_DN733_c0_g1_i1.p1 TRINITY_DN733_c0_g1~~TRINITY_DN733_c0_g1_i1.p1  ORF type:complete len:252 (-),score=57.46 TRINITY_DN733_c0_g1_i1:98-790(-)